MPQDLNKIEQRMLDDAWRVEAETRLAEIERGKARTVPADQVFENISRRFRRSRESGNP